MQSLYGAIVNYKIQSTMNNKNLRNYTIKPQGLGDSIHKFTSMTGLDKVAQNLSNTLTGKKDCGCNKRRQALNKAFPYKK